jgi:O-succinylhomoserine sulfhydrylase
MSATQDPLGDNRFRPDTLAVRAGLARSNFDETAEALYLTSGFVYASAEQAEAAFKDEVEHFIYSRYGNPTVSMFEESRWRRCLARATASCPRAGCSAPVS